VAINSNARNKISLLRSCSFLVSFFSAVDDILPFGLIGAQFTREWRELYFLIVVILLGVLICACADQLFQISRHRQRFYHDR
jgi:hypothetical protein